MVPVGQLLRGWDVVLEQKVPKPRVFARKSQVTIRRSVDALIGFVRSHSIELRAKMVQHPPLDSEDAIAEVSERIVERARTIIVTPRDLACGQTCETTFVDQIRRRLDDQLAWLVCSMKGSAAHETPARKLP